MYQNQIGEMKNIPAQKEAKQKGKKANTNSKSSGTLVFRHFG